MCIQTAVFTAVCYGETSSNTTGSDLLDSPEKFYTGNSSADTFWMVIKVIFFLIIIIGIFLLIVKVISQKNKFSTGRSIRSLGGLPIGQNKSIQVIEIGNSLYIIGVGDNIQLLEKIDNEIEVALIKETMTSIQSFPGPSFESIGSWLKNLIKKRENEDEVEWSASFQEVFQNKMKHMSDRKKMMEELLTEDKKSDQLNDKL